MAAACGCRCRLYASSQAGGHHSHAHEERKVGGVVDRLHFRGAGGSMHCCCHGPSPPRPECAPSAARPSQAQQSVPARRSTAQPLGRALASTCLHHLSLCQGAHGAGGHPALHSGASDVLRTGGGRWARKCPLGCSNTLLEGRAAVHPAAGCAEGPSPHRQARGAAGGVDGGTPAGACARGEGQRRGERLATLLQSLAACRLMCGRMCPRAGHGARPQAASLSSKQCHQQCKAKQCVGPRL